MRELWLYDLMDRSGVRNYRAKIMLMAFVGTHIPLIALVSYVALRASSDWMSFLATVGVTLAATLVGTGLTLFVLNKLLQPVLMTSRTLRAYCATRDTGSLPTTYSDEVGTLMADAAQTLTQLERALDALEHVDTATGLPNRAKLAIDLDRRIAEDGTLSVCAVRFGNHRQLADTLDLAAAEAATKVVAARLQASLGAETLYRAGAGDFVMLVEGGTGEGLEARLKALLAASSDAIKVDAVLVQPALLAGVSVFPQDGARAEQLIDQAVGAIAHATIDLPVSGHSVEARKAALARLTLEQDLRRALRRDEFVLHYQPVVDLGRGHAIGAEALIRWHHPERGLLPPGHFIGAAETSGLIDPIGLWVLRKACQQLRAWNDSGLPGLKVAVNLSARQFTDPDLVRHVDEALRTAGIAADQLEVELTETAAMVDAGRTSAVFGRLRDLGVSIAIDDFGTGYASMSYLRKLPFDKLKIDREFVSGIQHSQDNQAICDAMITLARGLKLRALAEGTETKEEVSFLQSRGCDLFQGYYFSKPVDAEDFAAKVLWLPSTLGVLARPGADREVLAA